MRKGRACVRGFREATPTGRGQRQAGAPRGSVAQSQGCGVCRGPGRPESQGSPARASAVRGLGPQDKVQFRPSSGVTRARLSLQEPCFPVCKMGLKIPPHKTALLTRWTSQGVAAFKVCLRPAGFGAVAVSLAASVPMSTSLRRHLPPCVYICFYFCI